MPSNQTSIAESRSPGLASGTGEQDVRLSCTSTAVTLSGTCAQTTEEAANRPMAGLSAFGNMTLGAALFVVARKR